MTICKIKNLTGSITALHEHEFQIDEIFTITDDKRVSWANNDDVIVAISSADFEIHDGVGAISGISSQIDWLKQNSPITVAGTELEMTPKTIKNEHCIEPFGAKAGYIKGSEQACTITLSNKSQDGLTFDYTIPQGFSLNKGCYVFQDKFRKHNYITSFTETTVTFSDDYQDILDNGTGIYSNSIWIDCEIPNWKSMMYLWGMILTVMDVNSCDLPLLRNDFLELAIIDKNHLFENSDYVAAIFGCTLQAVEPILLGMGFEWSEEYNGCWTKYYDESFACNYANRGEIKTPDGAPGGVLVGLFVRLSYFCLDTSTIELEIRVDHISTSRDAS